MPTDMCPWRCASRLDHGLPLRLEAVEQRDARRSTRLAEPSHVVASAVHALVQQLEDMLADNGVTEPFDAVAWITNWVHEPVPALGGVAPVTYLDTEEGRQLVSALLARASSGAYA